MILLGARLWLLTKPYVPIKKKGNSYSLLFLPNWPFMIALSQEKDAMVQSNCFF